MHTLLTRCTCVLFVLLACTSYAQQDRRQTIDTIFTEIELTGEGVSAVDTAGNHWLYDFDSSRFVPDTDAPQTTRRGEGFGREVVAAPVEERCDDEKIVKPLEKSVIVGYDEFVDGGIIAYGRVTVKGWVKGDVQSVSGRVLVTEWGQVDGDIRAPEILVEEGGLVKGRQIITDPFDFPAQVLSRPFSADGLVIVFGFSMALVVLGFLLIALLPRQYGNFRDCVVNFKIRAVFMGVLFIFLMPLIVVLFAITIIGIIFLPFIPVAYMLAVAAGILSVGNVIGDFLSQRLLGGRGSTLMKATGGTLVFMLMWVVVAILLGSGSGVAQGFGVFFLVVSIIISLYPVLAGIGAAFLTRFGNRVHTGAGFTRGKVSEAPTPAPPPIPDMPGFVAPPPMPPRPPDSPGMSASSHPAPPLGPDFKPPLSTGNN